MPAAAAPGAPARRRRRHRGQGRLSWSTRPSPDPGPSPVPRHTPAPGPPWTRWPSGLTAHQTAAHLTGTHSWSSSPTQIQHGSRRIFLQHRSRDCFRSSQRDDHGSAARSHRCEPRWQNRFPPYPPGRDDVVNAMGTAVLRQVCWTFEWTFKGPVHRPPSRRHDPANAEGEVPLRPAPRPPAPRTSFVLPATPVFPSPQRRGGGHLPRDAIRFGGEPVGAGEGALRHRFLPCRYARDHGPGVIRRTRSSRARGRHRPGVLGSGAGR